MIIYLIAAFVAGCITILILSRALGWNASAETTAAAQADALMEAARQEIEEIKKAAEVEGREIARGIKADAEQENLQRQEELTKLKQELADTQAENERQQKKNKKAEKDLERRERSIAGREKQAAAMEEKAQEAKQNAVKTLESIANLSADEARRQLEELMTEEARASAADEIKAIQEEAEAKAQMKSKEIIATAIQRYASEFVAERTVAVVPLPSDDMKGRLIGREGRNIRALEAAAGIDLIIDDTSEAITVSCFNPVRREIARIAVGKLVADGRIHPTRIEEVVASSEKEVASVCKEAGEQAVFDLGLHKMHPELVMHLGRLKLRTSYASNVLDHSVEVGFLAGLLAAEVGVNVKHARRAGLLHDIGKAVDHQVEGTHAEVGAQLARKHGESPKICAAITSHHGSPEPTTVLGHIVEAANALSAARPGARREVLASYIQRLFDLEELANSFPGVKKTFAVQAGREVRIMVHNDKVNDGEARLLSRDIAKKIEAEATYPGQIRVVVIRETRASDYAH